MDGINAFNNSQIYNGGELNNVDVVGDASKIKKNKKSIFQLPGDKNNNNVVDFQDFDDEADAKFFEEKGLIGKTWDYLKLHVGKLLGIKNATVNITYKGANESYLSYTMEVNSNGDVESYTQDWGEGTIYTQKFDLDEHGNPLNATLYRTKTRTGITCEESQTKYENYYDDNGNLLKRISVESNVAAGALGSRTETFHPDGRLDTTITANRDKTGNTPDVEEYDEHGRKIIYRRDIYEKEPDEAKYNINQAQFKYNSGKIDVNKYKIADSADDFLIP
ncbi:hypothetical protein IJ674_03215 [bacterium]|nr:hypothetical protein [bacterium]